MEISKLTNAAMKILLENQKDFVEKNINDTQLFNYKDGEYEFDESLLQKEGFIEKLLSNEKNALTKEQLGTLYDAVASLDNKEGMSKEDLETLASFANAFDKIDPNGKTINELDIAEFLKNLEEAENVGDEICETCPDDCACGCKDPEIFNSTESISNVFKADDRIKTDDDGQKYVNVEDWQNGNNNTNDCLSRIINNSYDLEAMGIKLYSEEYYELEKAVMDANPEIYGTEDGGGRKRILDGERNNSILYTGDKIVLPEFDYEKKFECDCNHDQPDPAPQTTPSKPDVTVTEGGNTVTITEDDVTVTNPGATVTVNEADVTVTNPGATVTVNEADVTVTNPGATVTVNEADVTVINPGATVTVNEADVTVTNPGNTVTVTEDDVTVIIPGNTVTITEDDVTVVDPDKGNDIPVVDPSDMKEDPAPPTTNPSCDPMPTEEYIDETYDGLQP